MKLPIRSVVMRRLLRWLETLILICGFSSAADAHIGSSTVFFEGQAGPYPLRIVVRPPDVIPGLAEISVRVPTNGIQHITALPMRWNTGRAGAPPPDEAVPVHGDTNLYSTQLWFMQGGAQSVEVTVQGAAGSGKVIVPVNAVATRVLPMPRGLGELLAALGLLLLFLLVSIVGSAVRESVLPPGDTPSRRRRWLARGAGVGSAVLLGTALWGGKRWWDSEAADYRNNRLYRPLETHATLREAAAQRVLRVEIADERFYRGAPLVPDHGKLMHLFLIREPGLDVFAHLHPQKLDWKSFETRLPNLPAGRYAMYADITTETGFAETLTANLDFREQGGLSALQNSALADRDDSWRQAGALTGASATNIQKQDLIASAGGTCIAEWKPGSVLLAGEETVLRFRVHDRAGNSVALEPYLGMAGHLVLRNADGSVFTHLHPGGSFSMAAQQLFEMRADGRAPLKAASATLDPICRLPTAEEIAAGWHPGKDTPDGVISFPYAFPKPGRYRLWLQFRTEGEVRTAVFDAEVEGR